tara:strand:- start:2549 stop:2737 length:189 start_codon:yes stop_codon:yes gene_type:complete
MEMIDLDLNEERWDDVTDPEPVRNELHYRNYSVQEAFDLVADREPLDRSIMDEPIYGSYRRL